MNNLSESDLLERARRLESFLVQDPDNPALLRDLAQTYHRAGEQQRALELFERLAIAVGETPQLLNDIGSVRLALGQWAAAAETFARAVAADPTAPALRFNLGYAQLAAGDAAGARENLQHAASQRPDQPRFQYYFGLACDSLEDAMGARQAMEAALRADSNYTDAQLFMCYLELETGDIKAARLGAEQALQQQKSVDALMLRAQIALLEFEAEAALALLREAETLAPNDAAVQVALGQTLLMLQRQSQARRAFAAATGLDAGSVEAQLGLGWSALLQNDQSAAEQAFNSALASDPEAADGHGGLALVRFGQGRLSEAESEAGTALQLDNQNVAALLVKAAIAEQAQGTQTAEALVRRLFDQYSLAPLGWGMREIEQRFSRSPTGMRVKQKLLRHARRRRQRFRALH